MVNTQEKITNDLYLVNDGTPRYEELHKLVQSILEKRPNIDKQEFLQKLYLLDTNTYKYMDHNKYIVDLAPKKKPDLRCYSEGPVYVVYRIVNKLNGYEYIGQHRTTSIEDDYYGSGPYVKWAINKYGKSNFEKQILAVCDSREEALSKEYYYVDDEYVERTDTYNIVLGGNAKFQKKYKPIVGDFEQFLEDRTTSMTKDSYNKWIDKQYTVNFSKCELVGEEDFFNNLI